MRNYNGVLSKSMKLQSRQLTWKLAAAIRLVTTKFDSHAALRYFAFELFIQDYFFRSRKIFRYSN